MRYVDVSASRYDLIIQAFFADEDLIQFVSKSRGSLAQVTGVETSIILRVATFSDGWELM